MPKTIGNTLVPRNPVARSSNHRGGVHTQSKTSERRSTREALKKETESWREDLEFERDLKRSNSP